MPATANETALAATTAALEVAVSYFAPRATELRAIHVLGAMRDAIRRAGEQASADAAAILVREAMLRILEEATARGAIESIELPGDPPDQEGEGEGGPT